MKKVLLSCFFAFLSFINTKCFKGEKMGFNSRTIKNRQMAETIINCISKKDSETLKSVFSEDTLNNVQTLDNDIKRLFAYCNGNVTSYKEFSSASFTDIDINLNSTEFNTTYYFNIGETSFILLFIYYPKNTIDIKQQGVRTIQVIKKADEDKYLCCWKDMEKGIFVPEE